MSRVPKFPTPTPEELDRLRRQGEMLKKAFAEADAKSFEATVETWQEKKPASR